MKRKQTSLKYQCWGGGGESDGVASTFSFCVVFIVPQLFTFAPEVEMKLFLNSLFSKLFVLRKRRLPRACFLLELPGLPGQEAQGQIRTDEEDKPGGRDIDIKYT